MIGQLLAGRYKVLQILAEGGFGQTYICSDIHLPGKPKCVLKHLKTTSTSRSALEAARRLFQKEADTLQQLGNHDQIPRLLAYFEDNNQFYLVQELIEGHSFSRELPKGIKLSQSQVIAILTEILSILQFVHNQGVIHRDIKPDNLIRRTSDNKLVLIDFGAIKQVRSQTATNTGQQNVTLVVGTRGYMPSEQIRRLPRPSSDIYALGMIAIQALTGIYPYELQDDPNTGEILWEHLREVDSAFSEVLNKMTRYHFKERYQTVDEVIQALKELPILQESALTVQTNHNNLCELTLEWEEANETKTYKITNNQLSKIPGKFRIGRDPQDCDIVLSEPTVSALHVEIFFNQEKEKFYLRNLRQKNPPILDGQLLLAGEMPLSISSVMRLGQQNLKVKEITSQQSPSNYIPEDYKHNKLAIIPQQPITKTARLPKINSNLEKPPTTTSPPETTDSIMPTFKNVLPIGVQTIGVATVLAAVGGFALINTGQLGKANSQHNNLLSQQPQLCRIVAPTELTKLPELRHQPYREVEGFKELNQAEKVLFLKTQGDFVQIKLSDGTQGWIFWDQLQPCD
ncbi:protein kinase [Plectonema cf. radiosum LEGE 06105]|uniref:non-specific serine/threonine protein kinase n=1 Tax=Plectonema cf. radiosum LEGE 06105 TaxID=945769 RepID=A0A8J7FD44_9CYAN|nr:FHA domain-containing serine/threonine-protein kinase [Plectonema radiosum]MBE9216334.1 protein kinase [Plectonema cf. radiosum LEGE 06105]